MRASIRIRSSARARCRSTRRRPTSSATSIMPPRCSISSAPATSIRGISNPTVAVLEERIAALEGGVGAVCTASGQAALHLAIATLMGQGGHIVSSASIYGGSHNLLTHTLPRFGITTTFVNPRDPQAFERAIRPETRLVFGETLGNPGLEVMDLEAVADDRARGGPAADDRRDLHHAVPAAAVRVRRRSGDAFGDQVAGRPRRRHRRRAGRQRQVRLGAVGQVPDADRALCRLSRPRFRRGVRPAGLHHARARRGPARFRRLHEPDQRLPHPAGRRDAAGAHGSAMSRTRARSSPSSTPRRRSSGSTIPSCRAIPTTSSPTRCCPRAAARSSASASRAAAPRGGASSRRCACSRISPMSATPSRW